MSAHLLLIAGLYVILGLFEVQFPAQSKQKVSGRLRNIVFQIIFLTVGLLCVELIYFLIPLDIQYLPDQHIVVSVFTMFVYIFLTDFIFYWYHRAEHSFRFLWFVHELHHSDTELNSTTSMRTHWIERPLQTLLISMPISYLVGVDSKAALMLPVVMTVWLFFAHANWKLRLGFLTPIICGPQVHRIHHSNLPEHHFKNLAQFFPVIDIMFGTYYAPKHDEFPPTGTLSLPTDAPIVGVVMRPFKKWTEGIRGFFKK